MTLEFPDRTRIVDENLWLEDIYGEQQLAWVQAQNERTLAAFDADQLARTRDRILAVYDSDDRIPMPEKHGEWYYNFWQDADHPRGLWRRTSLESYRTDRPDWDVLLDVGALGQEEDTEWVFAGVEHCRTELNRALVRLSPDGGDAVNVREFDIETKSFVDDGFVVPYAKSRTSWIDEDTIFVATDFGEDTLTTSGYPRQARRWKRGTPLADADLIHEVPQHHMTIGIGHDSMPGYQRDLVVDVIDFFSRQYYLLDQDRLVPIDVPTDATITLHAEWLTVQPKYDWTIDGTTILTGSLVVIMLEQFLAGSRQFVTVFEPTDATSLVSVSWTRDHLLLNTINHVVSQVIIATPGEPEWTFSTIDTPKMQTTSVSAEDEEHSNAYWIVSTGFLHPTALSRGDVEADSLPQQLKQMPALFDDEGFHVEQHFAISSDGTRVPYFQVSKSDLPMDGSTPTLLYAYGGFEVSLLPAYDAATGRAWLEEGGVYIVANIRGGGEYGPAWHTTALRENRHRAYDDFSAVAKDLISRGVTSPEHLGCMGGSNGGLLVGNMLTHYPELFGAIVCTVPLLDMKRYVHLNAGASWIAEYGDPENPDDWAFIQTFSPYHNLRDGVTYPPVLFYTATSDDRVGPVQARKMAASMQDRGIPNVWFYENTQGGHGGAADNAQRAHMRAMSMEFLRKHLA